MALRKAVFEMPVVWRPWHRQRISISDPFHCHGLRCRSIRLSSTSTARRSNRVTLLAAGSITAGILTGLGLSSPENPRNEKEQKVCAKKETFDDRDPSLARFRLSEVHEHGPNHPNPWVMHEDRVYDITDWIPAHPGGDVILRAAGGSIDPYWDIFAIHKAPHVQEILDEFLIGFVDAADLVDGRPPADEIEDPFSEDPERDPRLITHSDRPMNAEPPADLVTEHFLTPKELFYVRNHMWVPPLQDEQAEAEKPGRLDVDEKLEDVNVIDDELADKHVLTVELLDGETKTYTLGELRRNFRHHQITAALQCSGNRRSDMSMHSKSTNGLAWAAGAISNAEWEGVRLADVLHDAGLRISDPSLHTAISAAPTASNASEDQNLVTDPTTHHIQLRGREAYGASIPLPTALDPRADVLLAFKMNGEPLPRDHGFPVRALVPGHVAARSVKWLSHIAVSDEESTAQWQRRDYKAFGPNEGAHPDWDRAAAIQEVPVTSAITKVWVGAEAMRKARDSNDVEIAGGGKQLNDASTPIAFQGYAYSGGGREIRRVDVSLDGGETWDQARLIDDCSTPATAGSSTAPPCKGNKMWAWKRWTYDGKLEHSKLTTSDMEFDNGREGPEGSRRCATLIVKATDDAYNAQPKTQAEIYNVRGNLATAWHRVRVCPCLKQTNGNVKKSNAPQQEAEIFGSGFSKPAQA